MTSSPENSSARRSISARTLTAAALALGFSAWAAACSSLETVAFSDGDCVAGGCAQATTSASSSSSSTSGGSCTVNTNCAVSWSTDIFAGIIEAQASGCTTTGVCHGDGKGGITLEAGKAHEAYEALKAYTLLALPGPVKPLIVPCDKAASGMLCNVKVDSGDPGTNPYGECGSLMPLLGTNLTMAQLNQIADWIACGAPEN